jgi:geranylgeranyl pyrophosphate synthase
LVTSESTLEYQIGLYLPFGVAYKIADDIHDRIDSAQVLGKDVLKDSDKATIPGLVGIRRAAEMIFTS